MDFPHPPMKHQADALRDHGRDEAFALFWEQGTGKTKAAIDQASVLYAEGKIDCLLVVAPNNVHLNWILTELPEHLPHSLREATSSFAYSTARAGTLRHKEALRALYTHKGLSILAMSYDAIATDTGRKTALAFLKKRRCYYVADESHRIKSPKAVRSKIVVKSGKLAPYRRLLSGTPVANGPFDVYAPIRFLDENYWKKFGLDDYTLFKHHFGVWKKGRGPGGREFDMLVEYQRVGELYEMLKPISSRVLKDDVLDLPPKLYSKRVFQMQPKQKSMYESMKELGIASIKRDGVCRQCEGSGRLEYGGTVVFCTFCSGSGRGEDLVVSAPMAITQLLRLQQITCGYVPTNEGDPEPFEDIPGGNPRLDDFVQIAEDTPRQAIVWARFRRDIDKICDALGPKRVVRFDGAVDADQRQRNKEAFRRGDVQWIAATEAMSEGHTLIEATTNVYYSNSFKLLVRLQSEDRSHRFGQTLPVLNIDQCAEGTIDYPIIDALVRKRDISSQILGDEIFEWIRGE